MFWGARLRGGIETQSSQHWAAKIMTVLNGEEEPPAVKLTLVVTLEEPGVLSSDLLIFWVLHCRFGFFFFPFVFLVRPFVEPLLPKRGWGVAGWAELRNRPDTGSGVGV